MKFRSLDYNQVFGPYDAKAAPSASSLAVTEAHMEELRSQLRQRDALIDQLREDIADLHAQRRRAQDKVTKKLTLLSLSYDL